MVVYTSNNSIKEGIKIQNEEYVNVRIRINLDSLGNEKSISFSSASKDDPNSICLFVAGGTDIDKKVEEANARLTRECR